MRKCFIAFAFTVILVARAVASGPTLPPDDYDFPETKIALNAAH